MTGIWSYLVSILVVAGGAILIEALLGFFKKKYRRLDILLLAVIVGILWTALAEPFALKWRAWEYGFGKFLGIYLGGAAVETYVYSALIAIAISSATIIGIHFEDRNYPLVRTAVKKLTQKISRIILRKVE